MSIDTATLAFDIWMAARADLVSWELDSSEDHLLAEIKTVLDKALAPVNESEEKT